MKAVGLTNPIRKRAAAAVRRRGRGGYILASVLVMLTILLLTGFSLLNVASTSTRLANARQNQMRALNLAIAGADEAIAQYKANPTFMTVGETAEYTFQSNPGETIKLALATVNGTPRVTSTATVDAWPAPVARSVRVSLGASGQVPAFLYSISAKTSMIISGGVTTTSAPTTGKGHVHSNGSLTVAGSSTLINGDATACGSVSSGSANVTGTRKSGASAVTFPDIDQAFKDRALPDGVTNGTITLSGGPSLIMKGKYAGSVTIGALGCTIKDQSVVWITGNLQIGGPILGAGTIVVEGTITGNGGAFSPAVGVLFVSTYPRTAANPTGTAPGVDGITLAGGSMAYGWFYAPYSRITISGQTDLYGGASAMTMAISGGSDVIVPTNRTLPPSPGNNGKPGFEEL
jgi:Tfp pilus assembly protein PilX